MAGLVAENYGTALFELACEQQQVAEYKSELTQIHQVVSHHQELQALMNHPKVSKDEKKAVLMKVFDVPQDLRHFLCLLVDKNRFEALAEITEVFVSLANRYLGIEVAKVESATELTVAQKAALIKMLEEKTQKKIELECVLRPQNLAGLKVEVMGRVLDNTLSNKLEKMKQCVATATVN